MDGKACRRGHLTLFADLDEARLLFATEDREAGVLEKSREDLEHFYRSRDGGW